jgi:hypothetical protein
MAVKAASLKADVAHRVAVLRQRITHLGASVNGAAEDLTHVAGLVDIFNEKAAAVEADERRSALGKQEALVDLAHETIAALQKLGTTKDAGYEAHLGVLQRELLATETRGADLPPHRLEALSATVQRMDREDLQILHNVSTPEQQRLLEAVNAAVGPLPAKRTDGALVWLPLLPTTAVTAAVVARARSAAPELAAKVGELEEMRGAYKAMIGGAETAIRGALPHVKLEDKPTAASAGRRDGGTRPAERFVDPGTGKPMPGPASPK